jgi:hypothetical protein
MLMHAPCLALRVALCVAMLPARDNVCASA